MPKLSEIALNLLRKTFDPVNPEDREKLRLQQEQNDANSLTAFSNFNKDNEFTPAPQYGKPANLADLAQEMPQAPEGSQLMDVHGRGLGYVRPRTRNPRPLTGKPQLRQNAFTGDWEWYQQPSQDSGIPVPITPTPQHGPGTFRDRSKAAGVYAEDTGLADTVIPEIERVQKLNSNSRGGLIGAVMQRGQSALNVGTDTPEFKNTADVVNTLKGQVSRVIKSTFGGQLSDSERAYLNEVYGAAEKMSPQERNIAMTNVITMLRNKAKVSGLKYKTLGGGSVPEGNGTPTLGQTIRVRNKKTGQTGSMPAANFDPSIYDQL